MSSPGSGGRLLLDIAGLLQLWWRSDRVRCSPREGRLLRIAPGSVIAFGETTAVVRERALERTPLGVCLRYACDGQGVLEVRTNEDQTVWRQGGAELLLRASEVEIYPPARRLHT